MPRPRLADETEHWTVRVPRLWSYWLASYGLTRSEVVRAGVEKLLSELTEQED